MSMVYVDTYKKWKQSDAIVVVGFGFGVDDDIYKRNSQDAD